MKTYQLTVTRYYSIKLHFI